MAGGRSIERELLVGGLLIAVVAIGVFVALLLLIDKPADPAAVEPAALDVVHVAGGPAAPLQPDRVAPAKGPSKDDEDAGDANLPRTLERQPLAGMGAAGLDDGPVATLHGKVHTEAGVPIAGAHVLVERGTEQLGDASTDLAGEFTIPSLSGGHVRITVSHPEYAEATMRFPRVPAEPLDVVLKQGGLVEGKVVEDPSGSPMKNASVRVGLAGSQAPDMGLTSAQGVLDRGTRADETGAFRFEGLPVGKLSVVASSPGYAVSNAETVNVTPGTRVNGLVLHLQREGVIDGKVVDDADGKPIARALIVFRPPYPASARRARTTTDGAFRLKGVSPGMVSIEVSRTGYLTRWVSGLNATSGETVANVEVRLQRPGGALESGGGAGAGASGFPGAGGAGAGAPGSGGGHDSPKLQYAGIGARLSRAAEGVRILSVFPDSPAAQVGLQGGDVIVEVDGRTVGSMELNQVVEMIKGREGRLVNLLVRHADGQTSFVQPVRQLLNL